MKRRGTIRAMLMGASLMGASCGGAELTSDSRLGSDSPHFTFQTSQDIRVHVPGLGAEKVELRLQTGERIYEGPADILEQLEFTIPSYQRTIHVSGPGMVLDLPITDGVAQ